MGIRSSIAGWAGVVIRLFGVYLLVLSAIHFESNSLYGMLPVEVGISGLVLILLGGVVRNKIAQFLLVKDD